jgi:hypothetical protein
MHVKQNHGLYPKKVIGDALKESPGGYMLSLKVPSIKIQFQPLDTDTIQRRPLFFAMTSNAGSTEPGQPYEMKYMDPLGNVKTWLVNRPAILFEFFLDSNTIDCHNQ